MSKSKVISLSIEDGLLERFDAWAAAKAYASRSQAFQALVREKLDAFAVGEGRGPVVATVTYVYDHHRRELMERIAHLQHEHLDLVVATTHVHLDHARCLEVLILRGAADRVRALAERIVATRGVERGEIALTSAGGAGGHAHPHPHGALAPATRGGAAAREIQGLLGDEAHARSGPGWHAAAHARAGGAPARGAKRQARRGRRAR